MCVCVCVMKSTYFSHTHHQKALASRLKDLEMFSAGIAQQMIRRQERMQRAVVQLEKGTILKRFKQSVL